MLLPALLVASTALLASASDELHFVISLKSPKNKFSDYSEVPWPVDRSQPRILPALVGQERPDSDLSAVAVANEHFSQHLYFLLSWLSWK